jgi:hypothetical protein
VSHVERWDIAKDHLRDTNFREKSPLSAWRESVQQV